MGNNELLLAISDMMDQKLDSINVRMDTMENKLTVKIDDVENRLSAKIDDVENRLSNDIHVLDAKIDVVDERLSADIKKINISLENIVIPRINHIDQCYLSTSERYIIETGRINGLVSDVQVIKSVVQKHSEQLQKIS